MYQGIFDTDFDQYTEDAVVLFRKAGLDTVFENLEGFPMDWKTNTPAFIKFLRDHQCPSFLEYGEYPYFTSDELNGVDRGLMFAFIGAHLGRQFEFVQSEWVNGGDFLGLGDVKDPIAGSHEGTGAYSFPRRPIPKCLRGLPQFVATRGGEYCFMPGLRALRWLAELRT